MVTADSVESAPGANFKATFGKRKGGLNAGGFTIIKTTPYIAADKVGWDIDLGSIFTLGMNIKKACKIKWE